MFSIHHGKDEIYDVVPRWFNQHRGHDFEFKGSDFGKCLVLEVSPWRPYTARLEITKSDVGNLISGNFYTVAWMLQYGEEGLESTLCGKSYFYSEEFSRAFGWVSKECARTEDCILGKFIRQGPYLNIPHPGTGSEWDSNLSLYITENHASFFQDFIEACR